MLDICPCTPCPSPQGYRSKVESRHFAHHCNTLFLFLLSFRLRTFIIAFTHLQFCIVRTEGKTSLRCREKIRTRPSFQQQSPNSKEFDNKKISVRTEKNEKRSVLVVFRFVLWNQNQKILVCFGVSNLYWNNQNKQNCFETNRSNPKFSEKYQNMLSVCFGSIKTLKLSFSV